MKPILDIAEYARSLFILSCVSAKKLPTTIDNMPTKISMSDQI